MNETDFLKKIFGTKYGEVTIFDIGAADFGHTIAFKEAFPNAMVYAFEADAENIKKYSHRVLGASNVIVTACAISDKKGEATFFPSENYNGQPWRYSGSLMKPIVVPGTSEETTHPGLHYNMKGVKVKTIRLDDFCKKNRIKSIDYMHIDVQGAEYKVIVGLGDLRPGHIFAETCEFETYDTGVTLADFDELMKEKGYRIVQRHDYDTLYVYDGKPIA